MENRKEVVKKRSYAFMQILLLVVAIVAFSWMVGSSIREVSASGVGTPCTSDAGEAGTCVDVTIQGSCSDGSIIDNKCPGNNDIKCCIPKDPNAEDKKKLGDWIKSATTKSNICINA
jgi:hypothetical protein